MDIKRHYLCLDFVTPTGENLLDVTSFADYNKCSGGLSGYYCDDQFSVICTRQSDGGLLIIYPKIIRQILIGILK